MITTRDAITNPKNLIYAYSSNPYHPASRDSGTAGTSTDERHHNNPEQYYLFWDKGNWQVFCGWIGIDFFFFKKKVPVEIERNNTCTHPIFMASPKLWRSVSLTPFVVVGSTTQRTPNPFANLFE